MTPPEPAARRRSVVVTPCGAGGPVLVRGADVIEDGAGTAHVVTRPVVAVCTCERSQRLPWCDGTHKSVQRGLQRSRRRREDQAGPA
jgi:CDGSH-type Zn-finger protein